VARWWNEVDAGVDSIIDDHFSVNPVFLNIVSFKSGLNIIKNWLPAFFIVDKISKSRGVDTSYLEFNSIFFQIFIINRALPALTA
jgi:hypothetical protein